MLRPAIQAIAIAPARRVRGRSRSTNGSRITIGFRATEKPIAAAPASGAAEAGPLPKLKVLVTGAHPDDPESGCGGTIARYTDSGHTVTALYLTNRISRAARAHIA